MPIRPKKITRLKIEKVRLACEGYRITNPGNRGLKNTTKKNLRQRRKIKECSGKNLKKKSEVRD